MGRQPRGGRRSGDDRDRRRDAGGGPPRGPLGPGRGLGELYGVWREYWPDAADYETKTDRKFPVALITP